MAGGVGDVLLAGLFLLASHFGVSSTGLRGVLVARLGERAYLGLYSLLTVLAFHLLVRAYRHAPYVPLWEYAPWQSWVTILLMPFAVLLVVAGLSTRNPSAVGQDGALDREDAVSGVLRVTRNPFLWGTALWAVAHTLPNGDAASLILFATIFALAAVGTVLLDRKLARRLGDRWERFAAATSNLPFGAIAAGRQRLVLREIGWIRLAVAALVYAALLHAHAPLIGVPAVPG